MAPRGRDGHLLSESLRQTWKVRDSACESCRNNTTECSARAMYRMLPQVQGELPSYSLSFGSCCSSGHANGSRCKKAYDGCLKLIDWLQIGRNGIACLTMSHEKKLKSFVKFDGRASIAVPSYVSTLQGHGVLEALVGQPRVNNRRSDHRQVG